MKIRVSPALSTTLRRAATSSSDGALLPGCQKLVIPTAPKPASWS
jgi:hypothetical protein